MRLLLLTALVPAVLLACSGSQTSSTTVVAPVSQMPITADTSLNARLRRDLDGWQARAELIVTMRIASPDTLRLHRGAQIHVRDIQLDARDSLGQSVERFSRAFSVSDTAIVDLRAGQLTGRSIGRAAIIVGVAKSDPATGRRRLVEMARLPVIVRAGP